MNTLSKEDKSVFIRCYYLFFVNGMASLILGTMMPHLRETYNISYTLVGFLLSMHSIGNLISSFSSGIISTYLGQKKSMTFFLGCGVIAFTIIPLTANPILLSIAFLLSGICRGSKSNFGNAAINEIATGKAWALNLLHGLFSVGAFLAPFLMMIFTRSNSSNWIYAAFFMAVLSLSDIFVLVSMKFSDNRLKGTQKKKISWKFMRDKYYITACLILFFYLCTEQGINGWLVTYFKDSGIMSETFAQAMAGILWLVMLLGRLTTACLSKKVKKSMLLLVSGVLNLLFFIVLLISRSLPLATIGIIGVGFSMASMYPTTTASIGNIIKETPFALSIFITIGGIGAILMPTIIGTVAENVGIIGGVATLIVAVIITFIFIIYNYIINRGRETL